MIHESSGLVSERYGFDRIIFFPPDNRVFMNFILMDYRPSTPDRAFLVGISDFLHAMRTGLSEWLKDVRGDHDNRRAQAMERVLQLRPHGFHPYIVGVPVIS
jgi:hypothetical protein